jgi:ABC-2 type transport system ATP-binding protein
MLIEDVWVRYRRSGPWVLQGVHASVAAGEIVVVSGGNGAGKSTLLRLAAGLLAPSRGRVVDRPATVGWAPERFPAGQPFTVLDYLTALGRIRLGSGSTAVVGRAVDSWIERLGLTAFRDVKLPELSKGTAQKVGLAQALLIMPQLLILDEPWEGLDAAARDLVPEIVVEVAAAGGAVLVSDHRGETARLPGAGRWLVADGRLSCEPGSVDDSCVVEIAVGARELPATVAQLRADGHQVLRVRQGAPS